jgi:hypothetical protein
MRLPRLDEHLLPSINIIDTSYKQTLVVAIQYVTSINRTRYGTCVNRVVLVLLRGICENHRCIRALREREVYVLRKKR